MPSAYARGVQAVTAGQQAPTPAQTGADPQAAPPSVESMGVSFDRIKRELRQRPPSTAEGLLKLDYYVEVMALAPQIELFTPEQWSMGPAPGGPPTHWDMVNDVFTRPEFRSASVPIGSIAIMGLVKLAQWQARVDKRRKAEEERRKRNDELRKTYPVIVK